jgi:hypothetical protein
MAALIHSKKKTLTGGWFTERYDYFSLPLWVRNGNERQWKCLGGFPA